MKTLWKTLLPFILVIAAVIVVAKIGGVVRWLFTTSGISARQEYTIDSLRFENERLDSIATATRVGFTQDSIRGDSVQKTLRRRERRDSISHARALDSLTALIPDTATTIPVPLHEAIVKVWSSRVDSLQTRFATADSGWTAERDSSSIRLARLRSFQTQNNALLAQVNSLEAKANPGLIRRLKIALPFVAATWGGCKLGLIQCD